jgi:hypothetical protein
MSLIRLPLLACLIGSAVLVLTLTSTVAAADKETANLEGKITFKGEPVVKGKVTFHPNKGKPVVAQIQKDGTYSAKNVPLGEMRVTVESKGLPKKYSDSKTSSLMIQVAQGKNNFDLDLTE